MSLLEELLNKYCPDGVEYKYLGELSNIVRGSSPRPIKNFITDSIDGINWIKIGDIDIGSKYVTSTKEKITLEGAKKSRLVKKGDFILSNSMSFGRPYILKIDGCIHDGWLSISNFEDKLLSDFLYYLLSSTQLQNDMKKKASFGGAVENLKSDTVREIKIPVPPIEVQKEIVRILDTFTEYQDLLNRELTLRKKQYEYYRDKLLTFNDDVEWKKLSEISEIGTGSSNTNEELENGKYPFFVRSQEVRSKNEYEYDETAIITSGDGVGVGKIFHYIEGKYALHQRAYRIHIIDKNVIPKYYFYYMKTTFLSYIEKTSFHSSVTSIRRPMLNNFPVPVPPLKEQERIVKILDRFNTLCNDITRGLPAEIDMRKKQYEYYRDKLLTFKEKKK